MNKSLKLIIVVALGVTAFVGLANLAGIWHGAVFIAGIAPLVWAFSWWIDWASK